MTDDEEWDPTERFPWRSEDLLRRLYVEEERSSIEIADELGCSSATVCRWLKEHGIGTRGPDSGVSGKDHPRWNDGGEPTTREQVFERDDYECQRCGKSVDLHDVNAGHAHHIIPAVVGGPDMVENMVVLCQQCHSDAHLRTGLYADLAENRPDLFAELREAFCNGGPQ